MMEKQKRLLEVLLKKTKLGELEWQESVIKDAFQVSFKDNSVRIRTKGGDFGDENEYEVSLVNGEGIVVDSFTNGEIAMTDGAFDSSLKWYAHFRDLYDIARRTALGSEKLLNDILSELDDDEIPF